MTINNLLNKLNLRTILQILLVLIIALGVYFRFYRITANEFIYYDEGLYLLDNNMDFLRFLDHNRPQSVERLLHYLNISTGLSLSQAKPLWFFLADLRAYFFNSHAWFFTRLLSALFGSLTLGLLYLLAKRFYSSRLVGLVAAALLAVLPSHVYYSRLGMQEGLSTFLFLAGFYFYLFPRNLNWRTFLSGFLFAAVFFTNYRMILIPLFVAFAELWTSVSLKQWPNVRKYIWNTLTFLFFIFVIGNINHGANTKIAFAWMFYQAHLAENKFDFINLFSFPYYIFRLESLWFGLLLFGNLGCLFYQKGREKETLYNLFPFALVSLAIILFTFPDEKGVRYLCIVMPFMAMAVSYLIVFLTRAESKLILKRGVVVAAILLFSQQIVKAYQISRFHNDYKTVMDDLRRFDPAARILSSQKLIQEMYQTPMMDVYGVPHQTRYLLALYLQRGSRYLILDPQIYVSHTEDRKRFSLKLDGYLEFIKTRVPPIRVYKHFNPDLLERFVLEHNENLRQSLAFLRANKDGRLGTLQIYEIKRCIATIYNEAGDKSRVTTEMQSIKQKIERAHEQLKILKN